MRHRTRTEEEKQQLARDMCEYLNDLVATDHDAIHRLVEDRQPCNQAMLQHPTAQVTPGEPPMLGLLGILNGFIGIDADGWGYVAASFDDTTGKLTGFLPANHPSIQRLPSGP